MATYKKDKGVHVKSYNEDPDKTYPSAFEGQLYYNSSDGQFKFIGLGTGTWASAPALNTARRYPGGTGIQKSAICIAGQNYPSFYVLTEEYDGTSWTEVGDLSTGRGRLASGGTATAAFAAAGNMGPPGDTNSAEKWNGSSWTSAGTVNTARGNIAGAGSNTAAIAFGGNPSPAYTEIYDGSSWSETGDLNNGRTALAGAGTSTAGWAAGAGSPGANVETFNGSSWTEVGDMNSGRGYLAGWGTTTSAIVVGGAPPGTKCALTESFDGTSWTETGDLGTANKYLAAAGANNTAGIQIAGSTGSPPDGSAVNTSEEFTVSHAFKKVTTG